MVECPPFAEHCDFPKQGVQAAAIGKSGRSEAESTLDPFLPPRSTKKLKEELSGRYSHADLRVLCGLRGLAQPRPVESDLGSEFKGPYSTMASKGASIFSIAMAEQIAVGHFNTGLNRYQLVQELVQKGEFEDEADKAIKYAEATFPAVTNLALAVEIILKQHHFQISGIYPRGHDIKKLCDDLPQESLELMRAAYDSMQSDPNEHKGLSFRLEAGPTDREKKAWQEESTETFDEAIEYM